jgi:hypothetical protein
MVSFSVFTFDKLEFVGNWKLDWGSQGQARYKPREDAAIIVTKKDGTTENITPAQNDVVVVEGNIIHIPLANS